MPAQSDALIPARAQPPLPADQLILTDPPDEEAVPLDVLIVGGGPAGLAAAIEAARLSAEHRAAGNDAPELEIGVLEKSAELGEHCLSGAVVNPAPFRELFPEVAVEDLPFRGAVTGERVYMLTDGGKVRLPTPPSMRNHGYHVASLCEIVRWLGEHAEGLGVNLFTGFPADALLMEGDQVIGVRTTPTGLGRDGEPAGGFMPPTDLTARVTVLAEGTRGPLSRAWLDRAGVESDNPQIYALGVKELWRATKPLNHVVHTLGWPLPRDAFGGSFFYPMGDDLVAIGLVVGLDAPYVDLDVHGLLQRLKHHPLFREHLEGGELLEWGAKTLPEGGWHALPKRLSGDGIAIVGDAAGTVDVATLKGIHYAMRSGILAARAAFDALMHDDPSADRLSSYDGAIRDSLESDAYYQNRNQRLAFKHGFVGGGVRAAFMQLTGGRFPGGRIDTDTDAEEPRTRSLGAMPTPDGALTFSKEDAVFRSGNATRDDIPSHLIVGEDVSGEMAAFYEALCPAGVYRRDGDRLEVNAPNCIDCKATDVLGPRWTPREGGSGPSYKRM